MLRKSLTDRVSNFLGFTKDQTIKISNVANRSYAKYLVPKKNGNKRLIHHPSKELKSIQYALIQMVFSKLQVHEIAKAYIYGKTSPIKENAQLHKDYKYSVRIDFKNFFPSIRPEDIFLAIKQNSINDEIPFDQESEKFIERCCFIEQRSVQGLPIGAPSSPSISNAVMYSLDAEISSIAEELDDESTVTRYADDIVFSVNEKGICNDFYSKIESLLDNTDSPSLSINNSKTLYMSRGTRRVINGLFITPDGRVTIGRKQKEYIKRLIYKHMKGNIDENDVKYLSGYLSYILDVEPLFYDKLVVKYGPIVNKTRKSDHTN